MLAVVHVVAAHTGAPDQSNKHPKGLVLFVQQKPSFKSSRATHSHVRRAEMELGGTGVIGLDAPGHVVVVPRSGLGVSLRTQIFVGHLLRETPLKSCNVVLNHAQSQLIANSMNGVSGARVRVLVLAHGLGHGLLVCRAERMANFAKMLRRRFRLAILSRVTNHQQVALQTQTP